LIWTWLVQHGTGALLLELMYHFNNNQFELYE